MHETIYNTQEWADLRFRALSRDGHRCTVSRLIGGQCSARLDVHHLIPMSEGGPELPELDGVITVCSTHHPTLEALRRWLIRRSAPKIRPCRHHHRYEHTRKECRQRRLAEAGIPSDGSPEDERRLLHVAA